MTIEDVTQETIPVGSGVTPAMPGKKPRKPRAKKAEGKEGSIFLFKFEATFDEDGKKNGAVITMPDPQPPVKLRKKQQLHKWLLEHHSGGAKYACAKIIVHGELKETPREPIKELI